MKYLKSNKFIQLWLTIILTCSVIGINGKALPANVDPLVQSGRAFSQVAKQVTPAVVSIKAEIQKQTSQSLSMRPEDLSELPPIFEEFFRHFNHPAPGVPNQQQQTVIGFGSGFIMSKNGYIITNNHVIENASKITVTMHDDKEYTAELVGSDPRSDVAVLKIPDHNFATLVMGNSDSIEVGDWVLAVGSPLGLSHSISAGIISAIGRSKLGITEYDNLIQTDAAINQGNSGGPLINLSGEVIGINTAIVSRSGGNIGLGFAIPINMVKNIASQIIDKGEVTRGYLGVVIQDLTPELAKSFGFKDSKGVIIAMVDAGSPADNAGLMQGDVILGIDNKIVKDITTFRNTVAFSAPGTKHVINIQRKNKTMQITVTVSSLPETSQQNIQKPIHIKRLGIGVANISAQLKRTLGIHRATGVVVLNTIPGTIGDLAGLKQGDVITQINSTNLNSVKDLQDFMKTIPSKGSIRLLIEDSNGPRFIGLIVD